MLDCLHKDLYSKKASSVDFEDSLAQVQSFLTRIQDELQNRTDRRKEAIGKKKARQEQSLNGSIIRTLKSHIGQQLLKQTCNRNGYGLHQTRIKHSDGCWMKAGYDDEDVIIRA